MVIGRVYSTHLTSHEGGNKTHASNGDGLPLCGRRLRRLARFTSATSVQVESKNEIAFYIDCKRCAKLITKALAEQDVT